jgi:hypothetical protein
MLFGVTRIPNGDQNPSSASGYHISTRHGNSAPARVYWNATVQFSDHGAGSVPTGWIDNCCLQKGHQHAQPQLLFLYRLVVSFDLHRLAFGWFCRWNLDHSPGMFGVIGL